ncbi:MFS transporter [Leptothoe spongobia]|uniref:MFS transporter n=1 Tax=Leptothoe spongobia TAU-MAC 1115 TaxID=1967444 RepID=A0A947DGB1_9CYAN|nr:MFS transporter [Leptothoe spongobia]MBT9316532.1 MFS transporter [Leptothoe spongobia TAU-MAC 1115]
MVEITQTVSQTSHSPAFTSASQPPFSKWALWNMSFGFLGIQFGWGLQMANGSAIFESLGANPHQLPLLWLAAPMSGLLIQPVVGYWSDRTSTPLGRRRPFFLVGALLSSVALVLLPNAPSLWIAAGLLWLLDASANVSMTPFRSFVADLVPAQQQTRGFIVQSLLCGLGAVLASAMPWLIAHLYRATPTLGELDLVTLAPTGSIPSSIKLSFYLGAAVFLGTVIWTVVTTPESTEIAPASVSEDGMVQEIWTAIATMPPTMRQLAWVQSFSWLGVFCMFLYLPPAIAHHIFGAVPGTPLYAKSVEWSGLCLAVDNLVCCVAALGIYAVVARLGERHTHSLSLLCGAVGLISISWIHQPGLLLLPMVGVGIAIASMHSLPYALLAKSIPADQNCLYMGIFNCFIVLPEIVASLGLGWVMECVGCDRISIVALGGCAMGIAALLAQGIPDHRQDLMAPGGQCPPNPQEA